jgi:hypothetical protein
VATRAMARPARARQWLTCSVVGGVITRMVRGGHWARRMAARLTSGGRALMRWWMGRHGDISSRAAALRRALAMVAGACNTGLSREVREAHQLKKKRGVGSAHRKRMTRHGWWLSGPIPVRGGGPGSRAPSGEGRGVKEGVGCSGGQSLKQKGKARRGSHGGS